MPRDTSIGWGLVAASLAAILVFAYLFFLAPPDTQWLAVRIVLYAIIAGAAAVLGWIGYTLATTPPPKPVEEIEKEIEEELKKIEEELKGEETTSPSKESQ